MKYLRKLGLASALALVATCGVVGSASATLIEPGNTAFTMTATNWALAVSGGGTVSCTNTTMSATTPAVGTAATWKTITGVAQSYSGCTAFGFINTSVTASSACFVMHKMGVFLSTAIKVFTEPSGCSIDVNVASIGCTLTIAGPQTIGNGTAGAGGIDVTNLLALQFDWNNVSISVSSNGVGFGCASAGAHTGTMSGNYTRTSATNVTVTP